MAHPELTSSPGQGLTAELAGFVARSPDLLLPEHAVRAVCLGVADTVATMIAGREAPVVGIVRGFAAARGEVPGASRVLWRDEWRDSGSAALINATAAHVLDYDDVGLQGHPSVVLVSALLAEAERLDASGQALVRAYIVGYEVWAELIGREPALHHQKGWHPTAVFGTVAVAAAVCALRGLDAPRVSHALALAASMAGGLVANFGSMTKSFHAGMAAERGICAVDLAQAGMTAASDALEHPAGFLAALSPSGQADRATPSNLRSGLRISTLGLSIKKYPLCFAAHRVVDACLDLRRAHAIDSGQIARVTLWVGPAQAAMLRNHMPTDGLAAKFSAQFAAACALVMGRVGLAQLDDAVVCLPSIQQLMRQVQVQVVHTRHAEEPSLAASDRVHIELRDGRSLDSGEVANARGTPAMPLAPGELYAKFADCLRGVTGVDAACLFERLSNLQAEPRVRALASV